MTLNSAPPHLPTALGGPRCPPIEGGWTRAGRVPCPSWRAFSALAESDQQPKQPAWALASRLTASRRRVRSLAHTMTHSPDSDAGRWLASRTRAQAQSLSPLGVSERRPGLRRRASTRGGAGSSHDGAHVAKRHVQTSSLISSLGRKLSIFVRKTANLTRGRGVARPPSSASRGGPGAAHA